MLTRQQISHFHEQGYLVINGVFEPDDILAARNVFLNAFENALWKEAPNSNETIINNIFYYFPELANVFFNERYIAAIKDIIGSHPIWIPECSIHRNRFIHWHKDTSIQESGGENSHKDYSSPLVQAAIYFQENDVCGGGLTVLPGSHIKPDAYKNMLSQSLASKIYYKLLKSLSLSAFDKAEQDLGKIDIATKPGDLLLFDLRIDHRSSFPLNTQHKSDKLAIFNTFGANNSVTRKYFEFMKARPEPYYRYFKDYPLPEIVYAKGKELAIDIWY